MKTHSLSRSPWLLCAAAICFALLPAPHAAAGKDDHIEARALLRAGKILPLSKILETTRRRVPGDVIEVDLDREDRGWEYDVKVLTPGGKVRKVTLDARTGVILRIKDD